VSQVNRGIYKCRECTAEVVVARARCYRSGRVKQSEQSGQVNRVYRVAEVYVMSEQDVASEQM
jgi:hypothetical protein